MDASKTTVKQQEKRRGGVTGKGFQSGQSGNPKGVHENGECKLVSRNLNVQISRVEPIAREVARQECHLGWRSRLPRRQGREPVQLFIGPPIRASVLRVRFAIAETTKTYCDCR